MEIKTSWEIYNERKAEFERERKWVALDDLIEFVKEEWACCGCGQCIQRTEALEIIKKSDS